MNKALFLFVAATAMLIWGCGSTPIIIEKPSPPNRDRYSKSLESVAESLIGKLKSTNEIALAIYDLEWDDSPASNLESVNLKKYTNGLTDELTILIDKFGNKNLRKFSIIERKQLQKAIRELKFQQSDLFNPQKRKKLGQLIGCNIILVGSLYLTLNETEEGSGTIKMNARFIDVETGKVYATARERILIDGYVAQELGIKIKGQIVVKGEEGISARYSNSKESILVNENDEQKIKVEPGIGSVFFSKPGFKTLEHKFEMVENGDLRYRVSSTIDRTLSVKCLVLNTLPGFSALFYNNAKGLAGASAAFGIITWSMGAIWAVDILAKPSNFFTKDDSNRYDEKLKQELYFTAGLYALNLFIGLLHGFAEVGESKRVIDVPYAASYNSLSHGLSFSVGQINTPQTTVFYPKFNISLGIGN